MEGERYFTLNGIYLVLQENKNQTSVRAQTTMFCSYGHSNK